VAEVVQPERRNFAVPHGSIMGVVDLRNRAAADPRTLFEYGGRFLYAEKKNSENLFIERWYQLLKEGGKLGVVLPDSVFDTNENLYIRLFLYRFFFIKAVVSLPQIAFQPYTPTKTSLLFATKKSTAEVEAWDAAWRTASSEYSKLRKSPVIAYVLTNDRLRKRLIELVNRSEVEWYPATNLLSTVSLPASIRNQLVACYEDNAGPKKKLADLLVELDSFLKLNALGKLSAIQEKDARASISRLLRDKLTPIMAKLDFHELLELAYDDLVEASDLNHSEDPRGANYCNA
jgi:type I restriction enzyme M protein